MITYIGSDEKVAVYLEGRMEGKVSFRKTVQILYTDKLKAVKTLELD